MFSFQVNVTSFYTGRGLALGFSKNLSNGRQILENNFSFIGTTYVLSEVKASGSAARLFFDNPSSSSTRRSITYTGVNVTVGDTVLVYVKV